MQTDRKTRSLASTIVALSLASCSAAHAAEITLTLIGFSGLGERIDAVFVLDTSAAATAVEPGISVYHTAVVSGSIEKSVNGVTLASGAFTDGSVMVIDGAAAGPFSLTDVIDFALSFEAGTSLELTYGNVDGELLSEPVLPDYANAYNVGTPPEPTFPTSASAFYQDPDDSFPLFFSVAAVAIGPPPPAPDGVQIDIKPGSEPNCFNQNGRDVIPVAVLGSDTFDVYKIDPATLAFGGLEVRVRGNNYPSCGYEDVNADGFIDTVCQFEDDSALWVGGNSEGTLFGQLFDGTEFDGTDTLCIVP